MKIQCQVLIWYFNQLLNLLEITLNDRYDVTLLMQPRYLFLQHLFVRIKLKITHATDKEDDARRVKKLGTIAILLAMSAAATSWRIRNVRHKRLHATKRKWNSFAARRATSALSKANKKQLGKVMGHFSSTHLNQTSKYFKSTTGR